MVQKLNDYLTKSEVDQFDICKVLEKGGKLMGFAGDKFYFAKDTSVLRSQLAECLMPTKRETEQKPLHVIYRASSSK